MARKKKGASAAAAGDRQTARNPSPDEIIEHLKTLNSILTKETVERRQQIDQLRSELDDLATNNSVHNSIECDVFRLVLSSQLADAAGCGSAELRRVEACLAAELANAEKKVVSLQVKADLATSELREAEIRLLAMAREKAGAEMDLERVVFEKELSRMDLDEKRKELANSEESLRSLEQELARISTSLEVAEENCGKLEEEGNRKEKIQRSIMLEKALLEKHLVSAQEKLSDIEKQQKASEMTSVRALGLLRNTTTEVLGLERAQENILSGENGVEVEEDEALQPFVVELKAIKTKIEEMNRKLGLLQRRTIFAAVSLVNAARES